ncbi:CHAT domain-containing protein [Mucidula mucida]|nr:CHAT domain-containing protein [Mucidula mucida]
MQLLQHIIDPGQRMSMRYGIVPFVRDTVNAAVAAAIQDGGFVLAMEWFEQGRCIIWGHISRLYPPLDEIRANAPTLAEDMEAIIQDMSALEALIEQRIEYPGREGAITHYQELSTRYETMITEAQGMLGLTGYMKPKSIDELKNAAVHSHAVAINLAWWRCDALILRHQSQDVIHVPLPQQVLKSADLYMRSAIPGQWEDAEGSLEQVLSHLWECIVEPILTALGCMETSSDHDLPRITWCASGVLAFLPLHAAGPYLELVRSRRSSALDLAIHSYVPSITSLLNATRVRHDLNESGAPPTIFAVSQPATPHQIPIPSTITEVKAIQHVATSHGLTWLNDSAATTSAVLADMEEHAWVHLACHAVQDPLEPLQSAFLLHDGGLTLRSIMRLRFDRGKALAVLSACQTATGDSKVPDEAVHLAAAGFQNVVGTMWSINDKDAPVFATAFYSYLINEASGDSGQTAQALHHAVRKLRDQVGESNFLKWVPFIHVGI